MDSGHPFGLSRPLAEGGRGKFLGIPRPLINNNDVVQVTVNRQDALEELERFLDVPSSNLTRDDVLEAFELVDIEKEVKERIREQKERISKLEEGVVIPQVDRTGINEAGKKAIETFGATEMARDELFKAREELESVKEEQEEFEERTGVSVYEAADEPLDSVESLTITERFTRTELEKQLKSMFQSKFRRMGLDIKSVHEVMGGVRVNVSGKGVGFEDIQVMKEMLEDDGIGVQSMEVN